MLRHAYGFQLANQGTDTGTLHAYLGHRNIQQPCATPRVAHALQEPVA
jgi:hypothetical protein